MAQTIFFDESGFTGEQLSNRDQPYFTYAGVAIDESVAAEFITNFRKGKHIQTAELKGQKLVSTAKGRRYVQELMATMPADYRVAVFYKEMALAQKFFEYVFEPVVADFNSFYYNIRFHHFISQTMMLAIRAVDDTGSNMLWEFERLVRKGDVTGAVTLFGTTDFLGPEGPVSQIREFAAIHAKTIRDELIGRASDGVTSWTLDLTISALHSLLGEFADKYEPIQPICDESKPLLATAGFFEALIGRTDKRYIEIAGNRTRLVYNLAGPVQFADSARSAGIQLADVIAAATAWALKNKGREPDADRMLELVLDRISRGSAIENYDDVVPTSDHALVNWMILTELVDRSKNGDSLIDGMDLYVAVVRKNLPAMRKDLGIPRAQE